MSDHRTVARFYGRWAGLYDVLATRTPGLGRVRERAADALALAPGDTVAEVGCGTGANLRHLRERVGGQGRVVGLDLTPGMLSRARRRGDRRGWVNVHLVRGDGARPPLSGPDAVLATFVVGMFDDPAAVVDDWCDLLAPGGRLALLNAARSERRIAGPVNAVLRAVTVVSTPPTRKLRYDRDLTRDLVAKIEAANDALDARAVDTHEQAFLLGLVRLKAGRISGGDGSD